MSGFIELARFNTRIEAELAKLNLGAGGIDAILFDAQMNPFLGDPVRLMVLEEDYEQALRLLTEGARPAPG